MPRIALGLTYDGTDFVGWQAQKSGRSVQEVLGEAVRRVADEAVVLHAAGRTDAGVHARQQVVHFDARARRTRRQWLLGINSNLPADVAVSWIREVSPEFDARRSAISRRYRYLILRQAYPPALWRRRVWWLRDELSCGMMTGASVHWLGEHDFSAFRAAGCQSRTPMRRLIAVGVSVAQGRESSLIALEFTANAFLQHMVRNLVGVLAEIGRGAAPVGAAAAILAGRDRTRAAVTAPAHGLTLMDVAYPQRYRLPAADDGWGFA